MPDYAPIIGFQFPSGRSGSVPITPRSITATGSGVAYDIRRLVPDLFTEFEVYDVPNWDGEDAEPITRETVEAARQFNQFLPRELSPPDIAPGADGTIGFEWREGPRDHRTYIIVEVGPGDTIRARRISETGVVSRFAPVTAQGGRVAHLLPMLFPRNATG
jgi:hypothetical protein